MANVLFVVTGATYWTLADGTKHPTGFWAEEALAPYEAFKDAGHSVTVATPGGVVPTVDAYSLTPDANGGPENAERLAKGLAAFAELEHPIRLEDVDLADCAAVFYPGGHGPMEDLAADERSARLLKQTLTGLADKAPWVLQDRLVQAGAVYRETAPWTTNVVVDRTLITGQNPGPSTALAAQMLKALSPARRPKVKHGP